MILPSSDPLRSLLFLNFPSPHLSVNLRVTFPLVAHFLVPFSATDLRLRRACPARRSPSLVISYTIQLPRFPIFLYFPLSCVITRPINFPRILFFRTQMMHFFFSFSVGIVRVPDAYVTIGSLNLPRVLTSSNRNKILYPAWTLSPIRHLFHSVAFLWLLFELLCRHSSQLIMFDL